MNQNLALPIATKRTNKFSHEPHCTTGNLTRAHDDDVEVVRCRDLLPTCSQDMLRSGRVEDV